MSKKAPKPKACKFCGKEFMPRASTQVACSTLCALALVQEKRKVNAVKLERKEDKQKREALKSRRTLLNEAQTVFNKYIRLRDKDLPCISCGNMANSWDAGHYRSVGAAPQCRFDEQNVHKQCVHCNQHKSGNAIEMRKGMVSRLGADVVERIENTNDQIKWTVEDAKAIKEQYKRKIKELTDTANALQSNHSI